MATLWPASALRVDSVTKTVGGAGDFATIQGAVDWFKGKLITGACVIQELDSASYDEAVVFEDIFCAASGSLTLEGDTRGLAGITYVDGARCNPDGIANGGTFSTGNECTLATNGARDQITVSGGTVDPDFDADGWGSGDTIWVYADDGNTYDRTINSISPGGAGNNVIEITVALPVGATLGNDGTSVCLKPDREIARTAAGSCIDVVTAQGIMIDGWTLDTAAGAACHGIQVRQGGFAEATNVATNAEDRGFNADDTGVFLCAGGALSAWGCADGWRASGFSRLNAGKGAAVACTRGVQTEVISYAHAVWAIAVNCNTGFYAITFSHIYSNQATARQTVGTAYYASGGAFLRAASTNAQNNGNGTDYNPAPGIPGYAESAANFGIMYAS